MKKTLITLFFLLTSIASAQSTTVTATITDTDGNAWANGTVTATFIPGPVNAYHWPGGSIPLNVSGTMNSSGAFSISLPDNSTITPVGSSWRFTICPDASAPCVSTSIAVSGSSMSLTSQLSAIAQGPRFPAKPGAYGYADVEVTPTPTAGSTYWNVTSSTTRVWTGGAWQNQGGGGGTTTNALTMDNSGSGAASGTTFNGNAAETLSYNTLGAAPAASPTFTGTVTLPSTNKFSTNPASGTCSSGLAIDSSGNVITDSCSAGATNYKVLAPSGDTTGATDTAALQALVNTPNTTIVLDSGSYYISAITISQLGVNIIGGGPLSTTLYEVSTTDYMFTLTWGVADANPGLPNTATGSIIRGFSIKPYTGVTQTAGGAFLIGASGSDYLHGLHVEDVNMEGLWGGIYMTGNQDSNWFSNLYAQGMLSGGNGFIYYNSPSPSGDDHFSNDEATGAYTGVTMVTADTTEFTNLKLNESGIVFTGGGAVQRTRIINPSIESNTGSFTGATACGITIPTSGSYPGQLQVIGGGIGLMTNAICNYPNPSNLSNSFFEFNDYATADTITGWVTIGNPYIGNSDGIIIGPQWQQSSPGYMKLYDVNSDYPSLAALNTSGTVESQLINDPSNGSMYFDYTGGSNGNFNIRDAPNTGAVVFKLDQYGLMYHNTYTVSALPACASATANAETIVTDATVFTPGSAPTGGGKISSPVYCQYDSSGPTYTWIMY